MRTSVLVLAALLCASSANARPPTPQGVPDKASVMTEAQANKAACVSTAQANAAVALNEQSTLTKQMIATGAVKAAGPHNDYSIYAGMDRTEMLAAISERQRAYARWMDVFCPDDAPPRP